jgi:hypothetical protein
MYSLKNVLQQSPEKVKITLLAVLGVIGAAYGLEPTLFETLGVGIAIERVLDLFYVAPIRAAADQAAIDAAEQKLAETALKGIELGKQLPRPRPIDARA